MLRHDFRARADHGRNSRDRSCRFLQTAALSLVRKGRSFTNMLTGSVDWLESTENDMRAAKRGEGGEQKSCIVEGCGRRCSSPKRARTVEDFTPSTPSHSPPAPTAPSSPAPPPPSTPPQPSSTPTSPRSLRADWRAGCRTASCSCSHRRDVDGRRRKRKS
jgi:hypothetical protein